MAQKKRASGLRPSSSFALGSASQATRRALTSCMPRLPPSPSQDAASRAEPALAQSARQLGSNVRRLRLARGLTLDRLADVAGLSESRLLEIEAGTHAPSLDVAWRLATGLGVPFSTLVRAPSSKGDSRPGEGAPARSPLVRRALLPAPPQGETRTEVHELKLAAHGTERAAPYPRGTVETLLVTAGSVIVQSGSHEHLLETGCSLDLRGDLERFYLNPGESDAVMYAMIAPARSAQVRS